jgi:hypothetical protein
MMGFLRVFSRKRDERRRWFEVTSRIGWVERCAA